MPSTYSSSLRLELQATGENANTWGVKTNNNLNLIEQAVAGYVKITLTSASATYALDITDGAASDGRNAYIEFVGTVASAISITVPDVEKGYWVKNSATGSPLTFRTSSGTGFTLPTNEWVFAISDGASVVNSTPTSLVGYARLSATQVFTGANTFTSLVNIQSNLSVTGNFLTSGAATLASTVDIKGATSLASTLVVGGAATLNGNVSVSGTFTAKSAASIASTLAVNGGATFNSNVSVSGTFGVSGVATFSSIVNIRGNTSVTGNFFVSGTTTLASSVDIKGAVSVSSTLVVGGNVSMNAGASVSGTFVVNGSATFRRPVSVSGSLVVNGNLGLTILSDYYIDLGKNQTFGQSEIFFYTSGTTYNANISRYSTFNYLEIKDTSEIHIEAPSVDVNSRLVVTSVVQVGAGTPVGGSDQLLIFNGVAPVSSVANGIILYAEDVAASSELKVRDEAGNVTTLSPHNFELCGGPSEEMAWGYYSTRNGKAVNVDMMRALRLLEKLSGEKLVFIGDEP